MTTLRNLFVMLTVALAAGTDAAPAKADVASNFDTYAAIAYSPATGHFGYAYDCRNRAQAERIALSNCRHPDAKIVGWVKGGWIALAKNADNEWATGYQYGPGAANLDARRRALEKGGAGYKVVLCVCSEDVRPEVAE
jgi:hypothetical protein